MENPGETPTRICKDCGFVGSGNHHHFVDAETYKRLMSTSKCCQICGKTEQLCYDHDHQTMEFRGVLCRGCNRSLGQLGDNVEAIKRVLKYLERTL